MRVKPKPHNHRECGPSFHLLLHTSYIRDYWLAPLDEDVFSGILSSEKASHDPGLCRIKGKILFFAPRLGSEINCQAIHQQWW
jgi:hypothetical protein